MARETKMNDYEYDAMYKNEEDHWWYKSLRDCLLIFLNKTNIENILDSGCGTGYNMRYLTDMNKKVDGFDISEKAIDYCMSRGLKNVKIADVRKVTYPDSSYDAIVCTDVIGALNDNELKEVFGNFNKFLTTNGVLVLNWATLNILYSKHDIAVNVIKRYSTKEITNILNNSGFKPLIVTHRHFFLFLPMSIIKIAEKLIPNTKNEFNGDLKKVNPFLNALLYKVTQLETFLISLGVRFPLGTSGFIVAQKTV